VSQTDTSYFASTNTVIQTSSLRRGGDASSYNIINEYDDVLGSENPFGFFRDSCGDDELFVLNTESSTSRDSDVQHFNVSRGSDRIRVTAYIT